MKNTSTEQYLEQAYSCISESTPNLIRFNSEIYSALVQCGAMTNDTICDIGCGRGYLVKFLRDKGFQNVFGIEPCDGLRNISVVNEVKAGGFFAEDVAENSCDIVICSHVLHHLDTSAPHDELVWASRIAKKFIMIIEVNNTNIPSYLLGIVQKRHEPHLTTYNKYYVEKLARKANLDIVFSHNMSRFYISGDSIAYRIAASCGSPPYCIVCVKRRS